MSASDPKDKADPGADGSRRRRPPDPLLGELVGGKYRIEKLLGRGGMGKVFRARQEPGGRPLALKVLSPKYGTDDDPNFAERFMLEASAAAKLQHPNNTTVYDFGQEGDLVYIAMELLEGITLARLLKREGPLPVGRALHIAEQIARALREAHQLGIIHRDVKPANVMLTERDDDPDFVKVLDFGLVKFVDSDTDLTKSGMFVGSPKYMPPEQIRKSRGKADVRSDVYSLGVVLHHMLTGSAPFSEGDAVDILMAHLNDAPPPIVRSDGEEIPEPLRRLVRQCMEKDAADRPQDVDAVIAGLRAPRSGDSASVSLSSDSSPSRETYGSQIPAVTVRERPEPPGSSRRWLAIPLGALAVLAAVWIWVGTTGGADRGDPDRGSRTSVAGKAAHGTAAGAPTGSSTSRSPKSATGGDGLAGSGVVPVVVRVESTPPGAEVVSDGTVVGLTPMEEMWEMTPAAVAREHVFELRLAGHRPVTVTARVADGVLSTSTTLVPRKPKPGGPKDPGSYKGDPY